ncbi:MAG: alpha/beta fold hydrolase [Nitriliruptorales bacterium]|nr:alpha/beta fold hydrolase [Nitriliruptorales bacterium]
MQRDVTFHSRGVECAATLYLPDSGAGPYPTVVMGGGWCYVKEIVMPHYAAAFTDTGLTCLAFDYRTLGASGGEPRQHIDPWEQIEDYRNAISCAEKLDEVDESRLGAWGISYSGGHVLILAAIEPRLAFVVSNIPVVDGYVNMRRVHGERRFAELTRALLADRRARFDDPDARGYLPMSADDPDTTLSTWPFSTIKEVFSKIAETEAPRHVHESTTESTELLLSYTVFPYLPRVTNLPVMMVVAEGDDITLWDLEIDAFNRLPTPNKQLVVLPDTSHMTLYSSASHLEIAAERTSQWLADVVAPATR